MRSLLTVGLMSIAMTSFAEPPVTTSTVLELRQYKILPGKREQMIALFDSTFVESQEQMGVRLLGQFRDMDDPNRFTWMREFPNVAMRAQALTDFYTGPVWKAHRNEANPLLEDNDNVLLLQPAAEQLALKVPPSSERAKVGATPATTDVIVATIYYLWKDPAEGFTEFFTTKLASELASAGLPVLGGYVTESTPNDFPQLPVRQHEKVFVWFTRAQNQAAYDQARSKLDARLGGSPVGQQLRDYQERATQILRLAPTTRSLLH